jgi:hypothetical protein
MKEAFDWLSRIIDSCQHPFHMDCAKKLLECFKDRFGETSDEYHALLEQVNAKDPMIIV